MMLLELIAKKHQMFHMTVPVVKGNAFASNFFQKTLKGFRVDAKYGEDDVQMILAKPLLKLPEQQVKPRTEVPKVVG